MIYTKDKLLAECHPKDHISFNQFLNDCEQAINVSELHSDEWSSNDEALANEERETKKRTEKIMDSNSVIKIYNKTWRSTRVCKVAKLLLFFFKNITFNL